MCTGEWLMARAVLFLGGEVVGVDDAGSYRMLVSGADAYFCADRGAVSARRLGIVPRMIAGDFDSIDPDDLAFFESAGCELRRFPERKDMTDAELALGIIISEGFDRVEVFGWRGGRTDHMLGNIALLERFSGLAEVELISPDERVFLIRSSCIIRDKEGATVSFIALPAEVRISLGGFSYPLDNAVLNRGSSLCISNVITAKRAQIDVSGPVIAVIREVIS